jgi:hypothetical protein
MKLQKIILSAIMTLVLVLANQANAAPRNMLPRFPEIIIEKGLSENFKVTNCQAKVKILGTDADTSLKVSILNQGSSPVKSSVKFRILYPTSENQIKLKINGKSASYSRTSPRHEFELKPAETIELDLSARIQINYSVDSVRKALREQEEEKTDKKKGFLIGDFTSLFEREKFGKRFMVGPLVSKWGVFPIEFSSISIEVSIPQDFAMVSPAADQWKESHSGNSRSCVYSGSDGFSGTVFLPESDREEFIQTQKILTSEGFMH